MSAKNRSRVPVFLERGARWLLNKYALSPTVRVGAGFRASPGSRVSSPGRLTVGHHASIGRNSLIDVSGTIGNFLLVAANVVIVGRRDHAIDQVGTPICRSVWVGDRDPAPDDQIQIGDDVWIGAGAVVLSGLRIGDGAVIAAGSVVVGDVPEFAVVAGCPARIVGHRFDQETGRRHIAELTRAGAGLIEATSKSESRR